MSQITLQTLDFSSLGYPVVGEFYLGVDVDGIPKLRRHTDTIPLYGTFSGYLQYSSVSYSDFLNLYNTSSLEPGGVYVINDFRTSHYIQYTDAVGDGTGLGESINFGPIEPLVVVATSNSTYDRDVKSLIHPGDTITWIHQVTDREYDHYNNPSGAGRGHIVYRKSAAGNSRDYDFRNVVFWRWNDGSGNYTVVRSVDAPNIFDYKVFKAFEEGWVDPFLKNEISSLTTFNGLGIPYYLDNLVISTFSSATTNRIFAHGVTIDSMDFSGNEIGLIVYTKFTGQDSNNFNKIGGMLYNNINGQFSFNQSRVITACTISNVFVGNNISRLDNSIIGTAQGNTLINLDNSILGDFNNNTGFLISNSNINVFERNNFNSVEYSTFTSFTYNDVNEVSYNTIGTVSGNIVNTLSGNTCSQVYDNISVEIKDNIVPNIYNNTVDQINENILTDDIYYNIGTAIYQNVGTMSIFGNRVTYLNQNTGSGVIGANSSDEIYENILNNASIVSNTVKVINSNTIYNSIGYNIGYSIVSNTASNIETNNVLEIENNILGTFSYNVGNQFKYNSITQSNYNSFVSFTNKNLNDFEYKVNYGTVSFDNSIDSFLVWNPTTGNVHYRELPELLVQDIATISFSATLSGKSNEYFGVSHSSTTYFNLPTLSSVSDGKVFTIKDESGRASINPIVIQAGASTIDGVTQSILGINYGSLTIVKKTNGWWII